MPASYSFSNPTAWASRGEFGGGGSDRPASWMKAPDYTNPNWAYGGSSSYNINPGARGGQGAFGAVPGVVGQPPNIWKQILAADPELAGVVKNVTGFLGSESAGELSPQTLRTLQNKSATYGQVNGLNLSDFSGHQGLAQLGLDVEKTQSQGTNDTIKWMEMMGKYQDDPALAAAIAAWNATNSAAPDPAAAYRQMMQDYLGSMTSAAGAARGGVRYSPGGGTVRTYNPSEFGGTMVGPSLGTDFLYNTSDISPAGLDRWNQFAGSLPTSAGLSDENLLLGLYDYGLIDTPVFDAFAGTGGSNGGWDWENILT